MEGKKKGLSISLTTQILFATFGGIIFGAIVGEWASNLKFIGDIFLRLIQMSVVLLVMSAVAAAVGSGDGQDVGKMGFHTFKWIIGFTVISAGFGVVLSMLLKPGVGIELVSAEDVANATVESASLQETILGFVPTNVISSMSEGAMVPCIVFALFFGIAMGAYTKQSGNRIIVDWVKGINAVITNIIKTVMTIAPIGIFCLLANVAGSTGLKVIIPMLKFLGLLLIGDAIQFLLFGPFTAALCKVNVAKMPKKFAKMSIMAVTTTSGAICLPTKMEDAVTKFGGLYRTDHHVYEQLRRRTVLCCRDLLHGAVNGDQYVSIPDGYGDPVILSDVYGHDLRTGRFGYRIYFPCVLFGTSA